MNIFLASLKRAADAVATERAREPEEESRIKKLREQQIKSDVPKL